VRFSKSGDPEKLTECIGHGTKERRLKKYKPMPGKNLPVSGKKKAGGQEGGHLLLH
jgi:hypothetical protein